MVRSRGYKTTVLLLVNFSEGTGTVEVLQRLGAGIHAVANSGQAPFIAAASKGHKETRERRDVRLCGTALFY